MNTARTQRIILAACVLCLTTGCDIIIQDDPSVDVQSLANNWPPYQPPTVQRFPGQVIAGESADVAPRGAEDVESETQRSTTQNRGLVPRTIVPIRRAEDWSLADTAMDSLGRIGSPAVPALVDSLRDQDPLTRVCAAKVLARIGPDAKPAVSALVYALRDPNESVRKAAARALGQIGPAAEEAVLPLLEIMRDEPLRSSSAIIPASAEEPVEDATDLESFVTP